MSEFKEPITIESETKNGNRRRHVDFSLSNNNLRMEPHPQSTPENDKQPTESLISSNEHKQKDCKGSWRVCHFSEIPEWLRGNDYLINNHRPPLTSFTTCFKSIFRIHVEMGNIWTHLLGFLAFIVLGTYSLTRPEMENRIQEKFAIGTFYGSAILCLGTSFTYHTVRCHSDPVNKLFKKLDYCGISVLIMGSYVPWLYYAFYCDLWLKVVYLSFTMFQGMACIIATLWNKLSDRRYNSLRAGVFVIFGLSGVFPVFHYFITEGWSNSIYKASVGWLILMGFLYILGAVFYASRIPEKYFPGKCDIWFQSHQIFHVLVIVAALVHYYGITKMAMHRLSGSHCERQGPEQYL